MIGPGIYVVEYMRGDGCTLHATVDAHCSLAAMSMVVEAERQAGNEVFTGHAELLCPTHLLSH